MTQVIQHAAMAGVRLILPLAALNAGKSAVWVGVLLSLFALAQICIALPAGKYADRYGFFRPALICVCATFIGILPSLIAPSFLSFCITAFVTGGSAGALVITQQRHVSRIAKDPKDLKKMFSAIALGPAIANFIGPFCAGLLLDHTNTFWALSAMIILPLGSLIAARQVSEYPIAQLTSRQEKPPAAWTLFREQNFGRLMLMNWLPSACWDIHAFMLPILGHERGFSATAIGSILGVFALAAFVIRMFLPKIASRFDEHRIIGFAMMVTGCVFGIYPFMPNALLMGAASTCLGLALGCIQPMVMSLMHQITPEHRHGQAISLRLMIVNLSSVSMPILFGSLGVAIGVSSIFWLFGAATGAGARLALTMKKAY